MKVVLVVGARKSGKTTFAKRYVSALLKEAKRAGLDLGLLVYDTTAQWNAPYIPWAKFEQQAIDARNAVIVVEEATTNLDSRHYSAELQDAFIASRHHRCALVLLFHSLRSVPSYIMDLANDIYLLRTNDLPEYVIKRFKGVPEILHAYADAQMGPRYFVAKASLG